MLKTKKIEIVTNIVIKRSDIIEVYYEEDEDDYNLNNAIDIEKARIKENYNDCKELSGKVLYVKNQYSYKLFELVKYFM